VNPNTPDVPAWVDRHLPTFARQYRASRFYRWLSWVMFVLLPVAVLLAAYIHWQQYRYDPRRNQASNAITVLVTERCPLSRELESALNAAAISYRRIDVENGDEGEWAFYALRARGVPVTVIGSEVVYGLRTRQLREKLDEAGIDTTRLQFVRETDGAFTPARR
jgi:glutaredoxin